MKNDFQLKVSHSCPYTVNYELDIFKKYNFGYINLQMLYKPLIITYVSITLFR